MIWTISTSIVQSRNSCFPARVVPWLPMLMELSRQVSTGLEAPMIRHELGDKLMVVTPGIRPVENKPVDDQKRTVDVAQAFRNGADYIVVGRPIRQAANPRQAALGIQQTIHQVFFRPGS